MESGCKVQILPSWWLDRGKGEEEKRVCQKEESLHENSNPAKQRDCAGVTTGKIHKILTYLSF